MKAARFVMQYEKRGSICRTHGSYTETGTLFGGGVRWLGCPECLEIRKQKTEEQEKAEWRQRSRDAAIAKTLKRFEGVGVPLRFQARTFANYRAANDKQQQALKLAQGYADNFKTVQANGASLIFCGSPGTGKTHLAAAIANQLYADHLVLFRGVLAAVRHVKNAWNRKSEQSEADAIADLVKPDLLILDDVGVQFGSEAEKIILFEIINGRYEQMKPTIITANLTRAELNQYLGERVMDRLTEGGGAIIAFDWNSYRAKVAQDPQLKPEASTEAA